MSKPFDKLDEGKLDVAQIFLCYMAVIGDVPKTAAALDLDPALVEHLAEKHGWKEKVRRISIMSKSEKPGDWERAQNRALNFVQAHRIRQVIDRVILHFQGMDVEALIEALSSRDARGSVHVSSKFFADLTAASERVHQMSYYALGDTVKERESQPKDADGSTPAQLHAALIAALNNPTMQGREAEVLVKEATQVVVAEAERKALPVPPTETSAEN